MDDEPSASNSKTTTTISSSAANPSMDPTIPPKSPVRRNGLPLLADNETTTTTARRSLEHTDLQLRADGKVQCKLCGQLLESEKAWIKHVQSGAHDTTVKPVDDVSIYSKLLILAHLKRALNLPHNAPLERHVSIMSNKSQMRCTPCQTRVHFERASDCVQHFTQNGSGQPNACAQLLLSWLRGAAADTPPPPILSEITDNEQTTTMVAAPPVVRAPGPGRPKRAANQRADGDSGNAKRIKLLAHNNNHNKQSSTLCSTQNSRTESESTSATPSNDTQARVIFQKFHAAFTLYTYLHRAWSSQRLLHNKVNISMKPYLERNLAYRKVLLVVASDSPKPVRPNRRPAPCQHSAVEHAGRRRLCLAHLFPNRINLPSAESSSTSVSSSPPPPVPEADSPSPVPTTAAAADDAAVDKDECRLVLRCVRDPQSCSPARTAHIQLTACVLAGNQLVHKVDLGVHTVQVNSEKQLVHVPLDTDVFMFVPPRTSKAHDATSCHVIMDAQVQLPAAEFSPSKGAAGSGRRSLRPVPHRLSLEGERQQQRRASRQSASGGSPGKGNGPLLVAHRFVGCGELWSSRANNEFGAVTCSRTITFLAQRHLPANVNVCSAEFVEFYNRMNRSSAQSEMGAGVFMFLKYDIERTIVDDEEGEGQLDGDGQPRPGSTVVVRKQAAGKDAGRGALWSAAQAAVHRQLFGSARPLPVPPAVVYRFVCDTSDLLDPPPGKNGASSQRGRLKRSLAGRPMDETDCRGQLAYETRQDSATDICPLCALRSPDLWTLIKHMRYAHPRLSFAVHSPDACVIQVTPNRLSDERNEVQPYVHHMGVDLADERSQPIVKRRCGRLPHKAHEFSHWILPEKSAAEQLRLRLCRHEMADVQRREFVGTAAHSVGHLRTYFNSRTLQPCLLDDHQGLDSDCQWIEQAAACNLHEFTDLNAGEKDFISIWNVYIRQNIIAHDGQVYEASVRFVSEQGARVHRARLYRNCALHFCKLRDHQLLTTEQLYKILSLLQRSACGVQTPPPPQLDLVRSDQVQSGRVVRTDRVQQEDEEDRPTATVTTEEGDGGPDELELELRLDIDLEGEEV